MRPPRAVLFISPERADYLAVSILHGLRAVLGASVIDWPKYEEAYDSYPISKRTAVYGRGFTAFFQCTDIECDRENIDYRVRQGEFDLVVFGSIWEQANIFARWREWLTPSNTILLDGEDCAQVYPFAGRWLRKATGWLMPNPARGFLYFKREWTVESQFRVLHRLLPRAFWHRLSQYNGLRGISFSIAAGKIVDASPEKRKLFARHIVDPEVAKFIQGSAASYLFETEREYYSDLQQSRFGITTKRAGWDCMRHYEIAANGCVPCFRDLEKKPVTCAPHGLVAGVNCIEYSTAADLLKTTSEIGDVEYNSLAKAAIEWASENTTEKRARQLINYWKKND